MLHVDRPIGQTVAEYLSTLGHWPAWAAESVRAGKYSEAVQICQEHLRGEPGLVSGRLIYGVALFKAGQVESATEQFYAVLVSDPENVVALKYLGDIAQSAGDEAAAVSYYDRIHELDPYCTGVRSELKPALREKTRTITLMRAEEEAAVGSDIPLRSIPFYTETMGDLYMSQGYPRLAAAVFRTLHDRSRHPRLLDKLVHAEEKMKAKE